MDTSAKRPFDDTVSRSVEQDQPTFAMPISPQSLDSKMSGSPANLPDGASRQPSPAPSITSSLTSMSATPDPSALPSADGGPPAKRRKLTFAERQTEKGRKEKERAEKKARQEEERRVKDEEKRRVNEEREEKRRKKELETQEKEEIKRKKDEEKEEAKRKKDEEKERKERAQSRIVNFFVKPRLPTKQSDSTPTSGPVKLEPEYLVLTSTPASAVTDTSAFDQAFLPFELPSNAICAPASSFSWDEAAIRHLERTLDSHADPVMAPAIRLTETLYKPPDCAPRTPRLLHVRTLVAKITASTEGSTRSSPSTLSDPLNLLRQIPLKYIFFHQDVRPPYIGTHTKFRSQHDISKIVRNPNKRVRPELDYDYDSEAEWQEPEEGDEVESNAESEGESNSNVDPDEMDDFLDDEETADGVRARRKLFTNDMTPICSGICWEDVHGHHVDTGGAHNTRAYKMEIIQKHHKLPIDPFSTAYWLDTLPNASATNGQSTNQQRTPLQARPNAAASPLATFLGKSSIPDSQTKPKKSKQAVRLLEGEELAAFKQAVQGSELKKIGLLSVLKTQFPKVPNDVLKDTLSTCAARVGLKEADKRWRIVDSA